MVPLQAPGAGCPSDPSRGRGGPDAGGPWSREAWLSWQAGQSCRHPCHVSAKPRAESKRLLRGSGQRQLCARPRQGQTFPEGHGPYGDPFRGIGRTRSSLGSRRGSALSLPALGRHFLPPDPRQPYWGPSASLLTRLVVAATLGWKSRDAAVVLSSRTL